MVVSTSIYAYVALSQDIEFRLKQPKAEELLQLYRSYVDEYGKISLEWAGGDLSKNQYIEKLKELEIKLIDLRDEYMSEEWADSSQFAGVEVMDLIIEIREAIQDPE